MENLASQVLPGQEAMLERMDQLDLKDRLVNQEMTEKGDLRVLWDLRVFRYLRQYLTKSYFNNDT